ncbi:hypothetical protein IGI04_011005 [Brassica rapa subsp. trilocularis]|uniref:Uncharacterized protein n=1 Tax=Brassica rapa subsp. trilocularis TaxID=1813537 RepID=A0ABQ7N3Y6_BRACM|nr:hypothetical protein IGI04_011005 [Brassica rapa subsp. trilocularis]
MVSGAGIALPRRRRDSSSSTLFSFFVYKFSLYLCICFIPCPLFLFVHKKPWQLHRRTQVNRALEPDLATSLSIWLLLSTVHHRGISYPTVAQCLLDPKSATSLVVTTATSALTTVAPPPVTALPLETWDFLGSVCGFTGVSLGALVGHPTLPKSTHVSSHSSWPDLATNYSHRLSPTLASCLAGLFVTIYTPDIEAAPLSQGFYGAKLHRLNLFLLISSIDGSSQGRLCGSRPPFLVAGTTVQECGFARSVRYHFTAASPSYYAVSSIDGSSQSQLCDFQPGAAIFIRGSRMSCSSRTPIHRVFTDALRPLFTRAKISPSAEALTYAQLSFQNMTLGNYYLPFENAVTLTLFEG